MVWAEGHDTHGAQGMKGRARHGEVLHCKLTNYTVHAALPGICHVVQDSLELVISQSESQMRT